MKIKQLLILGIALLLVGGIYYYYFIYNDTSTSWRTNPGNVDIVISEANKDSYSEEREDDNNIKSPKQETIEEANPPKEIYLKIKAKNLLDLNAQLKLKSEQILIDNSNLAPENLNLDLDNFTFSCKFSDKKNTNSIQKLGLYYGPIDTGCESCEAVVNKNPGSQVFLLKENNFLIAQIIGIKAN